MKISKLFAAAMAGMLILLTNSGVDARPQADSPKQQSVQSIREGSERLNQLNEKINTLLTKINERSQSYPEIINRLKQHVDNIEMAGEQVNKLLKDLREITNNMDVNSDYHKEIKRLAGAINTIIAKLKVKDDKNMTSYLNKMKSRLEKLKDLDRRRKQTVIQARNVIRSLEDKQETLELIIQIGDIDAAIAILEDSQENFEDIVQIAQEVNAGITSAISTP